VFSIFKELLLLDSVGVHFYAIFVGIVRFEVFTAVTMKNGVFWVVMPCGSCGPHCQGGH
jgi:hypothetical protein